MNCDEALRILVEPNHHLHKEALAYVGQEPSCLARVDQLARAILSDLEEETTCAEAQLQLPQYYKLERTQKDYAAELPIIHAHLNRCPECQADYKMLQDATLALEADPITAATPTPVFDLSFLSSPQRASTIESKPAIESKFWQVHDQVRTLFDQVRVTISDHAASIADMGPQLIPEMVPVPMRDGEDDAQYAILILPDDEANVRFQIDTIPSREGTVQLTLRIFESEQKRPIPDVRVTLRKATGSLVAGSLTDGDGMVEFSRITADAYSVQAQHDGKTWALPITIIQH